MKNIIKRKKTINLLLQSSELDFQFSISRLFWDEVKFLPSLKERFPFWQWIQIEVQFIVYKGTHDQLKMNPKCSSDTIVVSIRSQRWQRNLPSVIVSDGIARRQQTQITASFEVQTRYVVVSIESLESSSTMSNAHWSHTCGRTGAVGMRGNRCNLKPRKTHNHGHQHLEVAGKKYRVFEDNRCILHATSSDLCNWILSFSNLWPQAHCDSVRMDLIHSIAHKLTTDDQYHFLHLPCK